MAIYNVVSAAHKVQAGAAVDTVNLSGSPFTVDVKNEAPFGGAKMYITYGWTGNVPVDPVAAGDDTKCLEPGEFVTLDVSKGRGVTVIVKLISNGNAFSVEGA